MPYAQPPELGRRNSRTIHFPIDQPFLSRVNGKITAALSGKKFHCLKIQKYILTSDAIFNEIVGLFSRISFLYLSSQLPATVKISFKFLQRYQKYLNYPMNYYSLLQIIYSYYLLLILLLPKLRFLSNI